MLEVDLELVALLRDDLAVAEVAVEQALAELSRTFSAARSNQMTRLEPRSASSVIPSPVLGGAGSVRQGLAVGTVGRCM